MGQNHEKYYPRISGTFLCFWAVSSTRIDFPELVGIPIYGPRKELDMLTSLREVRIADYSARRKILARIGFWVSDISFLITALFILYCFISQGAM